MSRARFIQRQTEAAHADFDKGIAEGTHVESERSACVADWVAEALAHAEREAAEDREIYGHPEDTPCLQSCDMWGTGEGQFHGVIA